MRAWFDGLQPRERWILLGGAAVVAVLVLWALVLGPLRTQSATLRTSVDTKQRLLIDLARLEGTQSPGALDGIQGADQTLVVIINSTAQAHGVTLPRTRPNGPNGIDVRALPTWIEPLGAGSMRVLTVVIDRE